MSRRLLSVLLVAVLGWTRAGAEDQEVERVGLRVTTAGTGAAVEVDRGAADGLKEGDVVLFFPREGGSFRGTVFQLKDRTAVVELQNPDRVPPPGTRGEALVPKSRLQKPAGQPAEQAPNGPDHPPWTNKDDTWAPGQPLLSKVKPVEPGDRPRKLEGRAYLLAALTQNPPGDTTNSYFRAGTDVTLTNPFGRGGGFRLNTEVAYLTETNDVTGFDFLLRRFSYYWGGDRFSKTRWEVGRFLQYGMPEFGVLDGGEWSLRVNGHRFGASVGLMPELDDDFEAFNDFQVAGYYEYAADVKERLRVGIGFQKTWHTGNADRNLIVGKFRWLPGAGWDAYATVWLDYYANGNDVSGKKIEVTTAVASVRKRWDRNEIEVIYTHRGFPYLNQQEFLPPIDPQSYFDRIAANAWWWMGQKQGWHAHASGFQDEDATGGAAELGLEWQDLLVRGSRTDVTGFWASGQFEIIFGARGSYSVPTKFGRWDILYEIANHHWIDFQDNADDYVQHRIRLSGTYFTMSGWDFSGYGEAVFFGGQQSWSIGIELSKRF